jgi:hypothetical protein
MAHGSGPGDDVPTIVEEFSIPEAWGTAEVARALLTRFEGYEFPPEENLGLYVAGWDSGAPALLHIDVEARTVEARDTALDGPTGWRMHSDPNGLVSPVEVFGTSGLQQGLLTREKRSE